MILNAAQLREQFAPKTERVQIFDTGHEVIVRALPAHIMDQASGHPKSDAFVFANAVVDEQGKRYYTDEQVNEIADTISHEVVHFVALKAYQLGSVSPERQEVIKKKLGELFRKTDWRIAISLGYPHPDLLFSQLTPEQLFELRLYFAQEPFGEMRADLRMAHMMRFYYDMKRGRKGKRLSLGQLTLYPDLAEAASTQQLQTFLGTVVKQSEAKNVGSDR